MDLPAQHFTPALVLAAAVLVDGACGEPPAALHPVVWIGHAARPLLVLRRRALSAGPALLLGTLWTLALAGGAAWACAALLRALQPWPWLSLAVQVYLVSSLFALRALLEAGRRLARALAGGDLVAARAAVGHLCSRDPASLDGPALASAGIESLSENTHDSVIAPLSFYVLGGLPALAAYRVLNTLDAMVGYRDDREFLGKAAARLDDLANFVPARLSAALWALSAGVPSACCARGTRQDARRPAGPNSGWPMATAAATLGVRLEKPGHYILGAGRPPPDPPRLLDAVRVVRRASRIWMACCVAVLAATGGPLVWLWHP